MELCQLCKDMDIFPMSVTQNASKSPEKKKRNICINNHTTKLECFAKKLWIFEICWKNDKVNKEVA